MSSKNVLVLCQSNNKVIADILIDISKKVLKHEEISLEFMSNPIYGSKDINGNPYKVNHLMYFNNTPNSTTISKNICEIDKPKKFNDFIKSRKKHYSLIIMNTCGIPHAPKLYKLSILNGLKQILEPNGLLIISAVNATNLSKIIIRESYKSQFNHLLKQVNQNQNFKFYNYFEEIIKDDERIIMLFKLKSTKDLEINLSHTILLKRKLSDEVKKIDQQIDQFIEESKRINIIIIDLNEEIDKYEKLFFKSKNKKLIRKIKKIELKIDEHYLEYDHNIIEFDRLSEEQSLKMKLLYNYERKIIDLESQIREYKKSNNKEIMSLESKEKYKNIIKKYKKSEFMNKLKYTNKLKYSKKNTC